MFCKLGFVDDSRPVAATLWLNEVWTRPVSARMSLDSASTYVLRSLAKPR